MAFPILVHREIQLSVFQRLVGRDVVGKFFYGDFEAVLFGFFRRGFNDFRVRPGGGSNGDLLFFRSRGRSGRFGLLRAAASREDHGGSESCKSGSKKFFHGIEPFLLRKYMGVCPDAEDPHDSLKISAYLPGGRGGFR